MLDIYSNQCNGKHISMFSALNFYNTLRTLNREVVCPPPPPLLHSLIFLKYCKNFTGVQNMPIYFKLHCLYI